MAWRLIGDNPLSEPVLTRFTDAYAALGGDTIWATPFQKFNKIVQKVLHINVKKHVA